MGGKAAADEEAAVFVVDAGDATGDLSTDEDGAPNENPDAGVDEFFTSCPLLSKLDDTDE